MNANRIRPRELATNTENGRVVTNKLKKKSDMKQWERKQSFTFSLMSSLTNLSARHCRQGAIQIFNAVIPLKRKQNKLVITKYLPRGFVSIQQSSFQTMKIRFSFG